jgi:hypothetical protein
MIRAGVDLSNSEAVQLHMDKTAIKKAENYMRDYDGIFIHTLPSKLISNFVNLKGEEEVCCSTVRSNSAFNLGGNDTVILLGFGLITKLYDYDANSGTNKDKTRSSQGSQVGNIETPELHRIDREALKHYIDGVEDEEDQEDHKTEYQKELAGYYDEGFLRVSTADVLVACLSKDLKDKDKTIKTLKSAYPHIVLIQLDKFLRLIRDTEDLMQYMYKIKAQKEDKELMSQPLHKYEENATLSFKEFFTE